MTSPHRASSSVPRTGCPPMGAVFGTGTSIVRTVGEHRLGYRRCTLTASERSPQQSSANAARGGLTLLPQSDAEGPLPLHQRLAPH
jgi:hypothetical protein